MSDTLDVPATGSCPDSLSDSEPETDDIGRRTSFESDGESNRENHGRKRLSSKYTADKVAEASTTNAIRPRYHKRKEPSLNVSLCKHLHQGRDHSSGDSISGLASDELPPGEEVKSALKEITSLLNTVVQRVERVESELQRQKSTEPSSSSDVTPTQAKPPIAVKVCLCYTLSLC